MGLPYVGLKGQDSGQPSTGMHGAAVRHPGFRGRLCSCPGPKPLLQLEEQAPLWFLGTPGRGQCWEKGVKNGWIWFRSLFAPTLITPNLPLVMCNSVLLCRPPGFKVLLLLQHPPLPAAKL